MVEEPKFVGLTQSGYSKLKRLKEEGYFSEMLHALRFAVGVAIAHGAIAPQSGETREGNFGIANLDPNGLLKIAVESFRDETDEPVYRTAARLAEWGINEMWQRHESWGELTFAGFFSESRELADLKSD